MFYYLFWLKSNRGTDEITIRTYDEKQTDEKLRSDCEHWCAVFGAWEMSDCSYGWRRIQKRELPKDRREALQRIAAIYKKYYRIRACKRFASVILCAPPFNGVEIKRRKRAKTARRQNRRTLK